MRDVGRALKSEADGKFLRKEFIKALKPTGDRVITELRSAVMRIPSKGLTKGQPLRSAIAAKITPTVRLSGRHTGVSLTAKRTQGVRGFTMAARRLNRDVGFNHPVYGRGGVHQIGKPSWFDDVPPRHRAEFERDVLQVVQDLADTLAARAAP